MRPGAYLRSAAPRIALVVAGDALATFLVLVAGCPVSVAVLALACALVAEAFAEAASYLARRPFLASLEKVSDPGARSQWATELVERPDYLEGEIAYDALSAVAKTANDEASASRRRVSEYREYIETWVHEAKSPLAAAHLMLENLEDELEGDPACAPGAFDKLDAVREELERVEGYIEQALFYARSEALERDYVIRRHGLEALVMSQIRANARALIGSRMAPVCRDLDREVFCDEKWIGFILGQIIQNSVKYARADGARIEFSSRVVDPGLATEAVELSVRDNGCGVSGADLPRVFDKGFTGDNGRTTKRATGIGLYLVRRLCDKMGVGVHADSREGEGFEVVLSFPTNKFQYFE